MLTSLLVSLLLSLLMAFLGRLIFAAEKGRKMPVSVSIAQRVANACQATIQYLGSRFGVKPDMSNATYAAILDEARGAREPNLLSFVGRLMKGKGSSYTLSKSFPQKRKAKGKAKR